MTSKVQHAPLLTLALTILMLVGCENEEDPLKTTPTNKNPEGFGADYEIMMSRTADMPDEPPHLNGDTLVAQVAYLGGCAEHEFRLGHQATPETTRLWLHHRDDDDRCSTRVYDEVRLPVPDSVLNRSTKLLMMPQDSVPFVLQMSQ